VRGCNAGAMEAKGATNMDRLPGDSRSADSAESHSHRLRQRAGGGGDACDNPREFKESAWNPKEPDPLRASCGARRLRLQPRTVAAA